MYVCKEAEEKMMMIVQWYSSVLFKIFTFIACQTCQGAVNVSLLNLSAAAPHIFAHDSKPQDVKQAILTGRWELCSITHEPGNNWGVFTSGTLFGIFYLIEGFFHLIFSPVGKGQGNEPCLVFNFVTRVILKRAEKWGMSSYLCDRLTQRLFFHYLALTPKPTK